MDKDDVIAFFNRRALSWDARMVRDELVIRKILDNAEIWDGLDILDVACGTGVLISDYLARGVRHITGIDIAPEMIRIAQEKFPQKQVELICGDAETMPRKKRFDRIMVYNAFPHFENPMVLLAALTEQLKCGGRLSIAHGMSREQLKQHHTGSARAVSVDLPTAEILAEMMEKFHLSVDVVISDERMYQVSGRK